MNTIKVVHVTLKAFFFGVQCRMSLKLGIEYWVLKFNNDPKLTLTLLMERSKLLRKVHMGKGLDSRIL